MMPTTNKLHHHHLDSYQTSSSATASSHEEDESPPLERSNAPPKAEEQPRQPLLFVDVNLGPARSERIIVRDGDTSEALAHQFCLQHGISDATMQQQLHRLLTIQMDGLLEKIDEKEEEQCAVTNQFCSQTDDLYNNNNYNVNNSSSITNEGGS